MTAHDYACLRSDTGRNRIDLWFESHVSVDLLLDQLLLDLLFQLVFLVKSIDDIGLVLFSTVRIRLADHLADDIYLWLEPVNCLFRVLISQSFALFALAYDELILASLKVLIVTLVEFLLACQDLAGVSDRWVESIRV